MPTLADAIPLCYGIISVLLHLIVLYVIQFGKLHKKFQTCFWHIYTCHSVQILLMVFFYNLIHRWRSVPIVVYFVARFMPESGIVPVIFQWVGNATALNVILLPLLINLNRFTVVFLKHKHNHFWNNYNMRLIVGCFMLSTLMGANAWFTAPHVTLKEENETLSYVWDDTKKLPFWRISIMTFLCIVSSAVISFALNCYISYALIVHRKKMINELKIKQSDIKLCLVSLQMFVTSFLLALVQSWYILSPTQETYIIVMQFQIYLADASAFIPPWSLLCTSDMLREGLRELIFFMPKRQQVTVAPVSSGRTMQ